MSFFNDMHQPRQFASTSGGQMNESPYGYARELLDGPSLVTERAYQYHALPPAVHGGRGGWTTNEIVPMQSAPMLYSSHTVQDPGPIMVYKSANLSPSDQAAFQRYREDLPHDVINEDWGSGSGKRDGKTGWSGLWRPTKQAYSSQAQHPVAYVEPQPMVRTGYVTRTAQEVMPVGYHTHQVISDQAPGGYYVRKTKKRNIFGL